MKKKMRRCIAVVLSAIMMLSFSINVMASDGMDYESIEYYTEDGTYVEKIEFEENGEYAAVIRYIYEDGSYEVTGINGDESVTFDGRTELPYRTISVNNWIEPSAADITYPHYTDYWYAGTDYYSNNGVAFTIAAIAALIAGVTGGGLSGALAVAEKVYNYFGGKDPGEDIYFSTDRYIAMLEHGPGLITIYYNKHITSSFADSARTIRLTGPDTAIYEATYPM